MPAPARNTAAPTIQPGLWRSATTATTGASTEDNATMNAERAGVVYCRPTACAAKPLASSSVNDVRRSVNGASTTAAIANRSARNARGEAPASASLTITKLTPQIAVAATSKASARRADGRTGGRAVGDCTLTTRPADTAQSQTRRLEPHPPVCRRPPLDRPARPRPGRDPRSNRHA